VNEDNQCDVWQEASIHLRNKKSEYLKDKMNKLESNSKNTNIRELYRGVHEFKTGYQPTTNLAKNERGDPLADPHKGDVTQTEKHTAKPPVPEPSASEADVATGKLNSFINLQDVNRFQQN
jgi:hypothetical protein